MGEHHDRSFSPFVRTSVGEGIGIELQLSWGVAYDCKLPARHRHENAFTGSHAHPRMGLTAIQLTAMEIPQARLFGRLTSAAENKNSSQSRKKRAS